MLLHFKKPKCFIALQIIVSTLTFSHCAPENVQNWRLKSLAEGLYVVRLIQLGGVGAGHQPSLV